MHATDVPGLERGIAILRLFRRDRTKLAPPEIAAELRIPRSTVHRLLRSLEALGLLKEDADGGFTLGPGVLALGFEYLASLDIAEVAGPVLARLRDDIGCSTHLVVLDRANIVFIARYPARAAVSSSFGVGFTAPARRTLIGRLLLGDPDPALARGYGISDSNSAGGLFPKGMVAISAAVRGPQGRIVAGINATTVSDVFSAAELRGRLKDRVLAAAARIAVLLGAPPLPRAPRAGPRSATAPTRDRAPRRSSRPHSPTLPR
jgi:DNA-binding IclR family transcriptional regulator